MATWPGLGLTEWSRWLPGHGNYQSGPNAYMTKMGTNRMTQIPAWQRRGLPEWPRWLHGQDGNYQSGPDGYMAKMRITRVAQMAT